MITGENASKSRTRIVNCWGADCVKSVQGVWLLDGSQVWVNANTDDLHTCKG